MTYSSSHVVTDDALPRGIAAYVALAAAALLAAAPFQIPIHLAILPTFYQEAAAIGLGLVVVAAVAAGSCSAGVVHVPRLAILIVLFSIVVYGQRFLVAIPYREHAELWMWYLLWSAVLIFAGRAMRFQIGTATLVSVLATAVTIGALLAAGSGLAQWLMVSERLSPLVASYDASSGLLGNFGQKNLLANYLVLGIVSVAYLWRIRRVGAPVLIATQMLLTFILQLAASRASLLMIAALTLSAVIWRWTTEASSRGNVNRWLYAALLTWVLILLSTQLAQLMSYLDVGSYALKASPGERLLMVRELHQDPERLFLAEKAWSIFLSSPLIGVGVGGFVWQYYLLETVWTTAPAGFNPEFNAHNIVLHFLAEFGLVGLFVLCMFAVMTIWGLAREIRDRATPELVWVSAIVLAETLHSLVEYPLWHAHFLGLAALALGVSAEGLRWQPRWKVVRIVLVGFVFTGAGLLGLHWSAYQRLIAAVGLSNTPGGIVASDDLARMRNTLLRPYVEFVVALAFPMDRRDLDRKLEFNQKVVRFLPVHRLVHNQILLLTMAGRKAEAKALLDRTRRVDEHHFDNLAKSLSFVPTTEIPADSWLRAAVPAKR